MLDDFKSDLDRYIVLRKRSWIYIIMTDQAVWALAEYRFSHWVQCSVQVPLLRQILKVVSLIWHKVVEITTGISIASKAKIGKGLYIGHFGQIFVNDSVVIGENCNLSQGVTLGLGGRNEKRGSPSIGDRVFIGPGAKIFGKITIGDDVAIGANAVVTKDLPNNAVAVGIPAKVINYNGSKDYIVF